MLTGRRLWPSQDLGLDELVVEQATKAKAQAVRVSVRNTWWSPEGRGEVSSAGVAVAAGRGLVCRTHGPAACATRAPTAPGRSRLRGLPT